MRLFKTFPLITLLFFSLSISAGAQCKAFAKKECLPQLQNYTHDGNYHAAVLVEGEEAELYKTFYSDMEYRVAIVGEEKLPSVEFIVLDVNKNVLYTNKDKDYASTWDFKLQSSQQLKIVVKVTSFNRPGETPASGCVAIMFGFKMKK
ncbi:MAG TPA: hypothetical protein PLV06_00240 [Bacteroidales bacterium]|nr:hypothetical protein [Bacteroidales bacterium]HPF02849.1 hypothetical protein [Bacteroidales bacterium]HPJ58410.1 hypothetical protein [Bacteroidales bacterium]HPR10784.1 hypothetical protein [Bacteroidales bacterium]HRW86075.1 hypothetical protein [Bacteroidales bacterium]